MKTIQEQISSGILNSCVSKYCYKELAITNELIMPAHTDQFLEFYLSGRYTIVDKKGNGEFLSPASIFIGHQTTPNWDLKLQGHYRMFFIHFTPNGFFKIFNIPMKEFTNKALDPESFIHMEIRQMHEQLSNAKCFTDMTGIVERFLIRKLLSRQGYADNFDKIINHINAQHGIVDINWLVNQSNLSIRQFERKFNQQLGISPKTFIRKTRLNHVINLKKLQPYLSWTDITYRAGYFDQAHMIKDFKSLTCESPKLFLKKIVGTQ
ncbi:helix-turn-helix domain-containing protein [Mucilaginibacter flavidus]|uniref:helix-turn-helix domain-containing protein n=1 Tax=Mucilaginibacter flavidus TaxID=2949309 RepID=UPI002093049B|nr:helix-turn-helix domain-containing protein [Mucilaginibacter flavidus]MCO5947987.1 helix-turn-helix domain-containing protein [Mucilaginibacter flavidus]